MSEFSSRPWTLDEWGKGLLGMVLKSCISKVQERSGLEIQI